MKNKGFPHVSTLIYMDIWIQISSKASGHKDLEHCTRLEQLNGIKQPFQRTTGTFLYNKTYENYHACALVAVSVCLYTGNGRNYDANLTLTIKHNHFYQLLEVLMLGI